ncbi:DNA phosphorothioation-associated putative methyltransferase [Synechocystis sp. PCC 7339]|uniref:DNA phosphorothioation-associated putative methyltransferase n=1 Tax=unclassified Synechocystis TaxID=2640012 RepID=UPI001BAF764B|nr:MULTISPECIES: DNA phosphorothioation-associated putative methyltransferase [unclassified Synechocystis]QUS61403.1 DNA phosphorothioation-associated putative methyltransferase [Synechocystis sp. PCC 7338]UAJ73585.1 DNA phosphorothioation-associated putative methyltransferase [Synechocystis sp. PCC 7339]
MADIHNFVDIQHALNGLNFGKRLPDALYIHYSTIPYLPSILQNYESYTRQIFYENYQFESHQDLQFTLIKFNLSEPKISYLNYPDFDLDAHPALAQSTQVNLELNDCQVRHYGENPPILHRKETFVCADYPLYETFVALTQAEEKLGLLANSRQIGHRQQWKKRLQQFRVRIEDHKLIEIKESVHQSPKIDRHKAAIVRRQMSRPVRSLFDADLLSQGMTFFDYGCGHGEDLKFVSEKGFTVQGWDPFYKPDSDRHPADVVNLGYVINVIENPAERREALVQAWELTQKILVVSAQVLIADGGLGHIAYGDGVITSRNTFQKYYDQEELKLYIDQVLGVDAIPVALGTYFVFRDESQAETFRASRFRSRASTPRLRLSVKRFEDYQELLKPLMNFLMERGRLPKKGELEAEAEICAEFKTLTRAFKVIEQATDAEDWQRITEQRKQDIQIYLALSHFAKRPRFSHLADNLQTDIKVLFGTYKEACLLSDMMLFSLGDLQNLADIAQRSPVGICSKKALVVHISALENLDPLLRLYEGCASRTVGRLDNVTLVRFYLHEPKIAYIFCPDFDTNPHPRWQMMMQIGLQDLRVRYKEYDPDYAPVVHRKERLVMTEYPLVEKFAKLSQQEEDWGLLDNWSEIQLWPGWQKVLREMGVEFNGNRLQWRKDTDLYQMRLMKAQIQARRRQK